VIARELVTSLRNGVTVEWMPGLHGPGCAARGLVKRILRKYGYPPDPQDAAVQTVLQQAEALGVKRPCVLTVRIAREPAETSGAVKEPGRR
jgi:type I restriction enzyme R subunit